MIHLYVLPLLAIELAAGAFDAFETAKGIKKGSGIESNDIINFLSRTSDGKPATWAIITYNLAKTAILASLSLGSGPVFVGGSIGGLIASTAGHIQGGIKWRYLNNGGQIDRTKKYTWWQRLLGMGW